MEDSALILRTMEAFPENAGLVGTNHVSGIDEPLEQGSTGVAG